MEMKIQLSSAKNWISVFRGSSSKTVEKQDTSCEKGKNPLKFFEAFSSKKGTKKSRESLSRDKSCLGNSSKGKVVLSCNEFEELNERLKVLEEETEMMKEAFFWSLAERKVMVNEIYKQFKSLHLHGCLHCTDLVLEESSSINPFEDWRVRKSPTRFPSPGRNPTLVTKELKVGALTYQEPATYRGHVKAHHD